MTAVDTQGTVTLPDVQDLSVAELKLMEMVRCAERAFDSATVALAAMRDGRPDTQAAASLRYVLYNLVSVEMKMSEVRALLPGKDQLEEKTGFDL